MKGDIIALATAVIIGGAFNKIVGSLAQDIIMPFIGLFMGGQNVNNMFIALDGSNHETLAAAKAADAAIMTYGNFLQTIINFIVIGFVIFMILRSYEKTKKKEEEAPAAPKGPTQEEILLEIRDELKKQNS